MIFIIFRVNVMSTNTAVVIKCCLLYRLKCSDFTRESQHPLHSLWQLLLLPRLWTLCRQEVNWVCEVVWQTSVYSITVGLWAILSCIITTWRITSTSNWNSQRAITRFPTSTPTCVFLSIIHCSKVDLKWSDLQAVTDSSSSKHRLTENMWLACFHSGNECLLKVEGFKYSKIKFYLLCGLDLAETKRKDMISDATLTNARKSSLH